jgi:hypothetical protein
VEIEQNDKSATTDQYGKYQILQIASNTYNIKIGAEGYTSKLIENVVIKTGTVSTLSATLVPISKLTNANCKHILFFPATQRNRFKK